MDKRVSNEQIDSWIDSLTGTLGVKELAPHDHFVGLLKRGAVDECFEGIAVYLGLPIKIDLRFVSSIPPLGKAILQNSRSESITAQVSIPSCLPAYGSPKLKDFPICVKVNEGCYDHADSLVAVMAHELSHVVLAALSHPNRENELLTDLTAMVLGFANTMKQGRQVFVTQTYFTQQTTQTTTYGYLSDSQFEFAYLKIMRLLGEHIRRKNGFLGQLDGLNDDLSHLNKLLQDFRDFRAFLDKNTTRRIDADDAPRIVAFHQPGYVDQHLMMLDSTRRMVTESEQMVLSTVHHTKGTVSFMEKKAEQLTQVRNALETLSESLKQDVSVLRRNLPFFYRLRRFLILEPEH